MHRPTVMLISVVILEAARSRMGDLATSTDSFASSHGKKRNWRSGVSQPHRQAPAAGLVPAERVMRQALDALVPWQSLHALSSWFWFLFVARGALES